MLSSSFFLSQLLAGLAFSFGAMAFQLSERRSVLLCWSASALSSSLHFALLGQITPCLITAITGSRFLLAQRNSGKALYLFFMSASLAAGFLTYKQPLNLIPIVTSIIGTTAVFFASNAQLRITMGTCSVFWLYHNVVIGSPVAAIMECVFLVSNLVGYLRLRKRWMRISTTPGDSLSVAQAKISE